MGSAIQLRLQEAIAFIPQYTTYGADIPPRSLSQASRYSGSDIHERTLCGDILRWVSSPMCLFSELQRLQITGQSEVAAGPRVRELGELRLQG